MLTKYERYAVSIAATKYGFFDFANHLGVSPKRLAMCLNGKTDLEVERKIRANWKLVKELLYGGGTKRNER
ncbi:hypothetical protein GG496_001197 [Candidatus Fervidibacteria bacterium JGI MDM2 JNZ-1-D12]